MFFTKMIDNSFKTHYIVDTPINGDNMKLKITFTNGKTKTIKISLDCDTEALIHKIEKWEYRADVVKVEVVE